MPEQGYLVVTHISTKDLIRIFSKIEVDPISKCWNWIASKKYGYGVVSYKGRQESTHRLMYAWLVEPLPRTWAKNQAQIDHIVCDNRQCCNPCHMRVTTQRINTLRSNNCFAKNARKTHCIRGHALPSTPNLYGKWRECMICRRDKRIARYYANHEESKRKGRESMRKIHGYNPKIIP